jgi:ssDNA thymidine ADP-ribosyltransferase, DarT
VPPASPKIYHITHVSNLPSIITTGGLISDAAIIQQGGPPAAIGMSKIKQRRLGLPVNCHLGDFVGDYVPFYFCPRSVMLYLLYMGNHPELTYRGGQGPIVHLEADLKTVVDWADANNRRWAFSLANAGAYYVEFRKNLNELDQIDWASVAATDFRSADVKEAKAAEFLLHGSFPWELVERIGVHSMNIGQQVTTMIAAGAHNPTVQIEKDWYF